MKNLCLLFALTLANVSFATTPVPYSETMERVEAGRAESFRISVGEAYGKSGLVCGQGAHDTFAWNYVSDRLHRASFFYVDTSSAQPLLQAIQNVDLTERVVMTITTEADLVTIKTLALEVQFFRQVNIGDLQNPVIVKKWLGNGTVHVDCKQ